MQYYVKYDILLNINSKLQNENEVKECKIMKSIDWCKLDEAKVREVRAKQVESIRKMNQNQMARTIQSQRQEYSGRSVTREDER